MGDKSGRPRKVHQHLVKDFNVITNRYLDSHDEKDRSAKHLNLLEATSKHMKQNRFDPVTQQFTDPRHEEIIRTVDHAREVESVMRAEAQLPPSFRGKQSNHYNIVSHEVGDKEMIKTWDAIEDERKDRFRNRYVVEHNLHTRDIKGDHLNQSRRLNRVAPERFEEQKRRGYDIIDNANFGTGHRDKAFHEPYTKNRQTPWERALDGRTDVPASSSGPPKSWNATNRPQMQANGAPQAEERMLTGSNSAPNLRSRTPSVHGSVTGGTQRISATPGDAASVSSSRRSSLRRTESMSSLGGSRSMPMGAPPGMTRPMPLMSPPPAPAIPGGGGGPVFSRPSGCG